MHLIFIDVAFLYGEEVYLKSDREQVKYVISGFLCDNKSTVYRINAHRGQTGYDVLFVSAGELTRERNV